MGTACGGAGHEYDSNHGSGGDKDGGGLRTMRVTAFPDEMVRWNKYYAPHASSSSAAAYLRRLSLPLPPLPLPLQSSSSMRRKSSENVRHNSALLSSTAPIPDVHTDSSSSSSSSSNGSEHSSRRASLLHREHKVQRAASAPPQPCAASSHHMHDVLLLCTAGLSSGHCFGGENGCDTEASHHSGRGIWGKGKKKQHRQQERAKRDIYKDFAGVENGGGEEGDEAEKYSCQCFYKLYFSSGARLREQREHELLSF